jgi:DNA-directed RNA polymerase subunit E'/Rpb7
MDSLFERRELSKNVHINSKSLQKNIQGSLLEQLKFNYEGKCSSEGFIQPQSITILNYSIGRTNYKKGGVDYNVLFQADICLPHQGQIFRSLINLRSKIGIHCESLPIKILIPRDLHIGNQEFDNIKVGEEIEFEVIGAEFKQQDKNIYVVGRLRSAIKAAPLMPLLSMDSSTKDEDTKNISLSSNGEEKIVVITPTNAEPEKKKRKLKKPSLENAKADESPKEGMA